MGPLVSSKNSHQKFDILSGLVVGVSQGDEVYYDIVGDMCSTSSFQGLIGRNLPYPCLLYVFLSRH